MGFEMKTLIISVVLLISTLLYAQEDSKVYRTTSLNFEFSAVSLRSFYGGIGGKTWLSETWTLYASIGGHYSKSTTEATGNYTEGYLKKTSVIMNVGFERHFSDIDDDISPYLSVALSGSYNKSSNLNSYDTTNSNIIWKEYRMRDYGIGLNFGFGIEFWITKRISLSGQHLLTANYSWGKEESDMEDSVDRNTNNFGFRSGTSALILAIYF